MTDDLIQQALNSPVQAPPAEWLMVGFTCDVREIEFQPGKKVKAMIFFHVSNPNGVRFIFPLDEIGARNLGNELLGKPRIVMPDIDFMPKANGSAQ